VLAPAIARFRVVLYLLAPLSAKLISHRNRAVAGGICAFVRLFDQVSHISPLQLPPRRMTLQLADHCRARRKRRLRASGAMAELRHIACSHQRQESLFKVGPALIAVTMRNVRCGNGEIYPLVSGIPQALCGFSRISDAQRATLFNWTLVATLGARKGR